MINIQIYGRKKCQNTKKAQRFFKERNINFQFINLDEKEMSPKELEKLFNKIDPAELIDEKSKIYQKRNLAYLNYDPCEELTLDQNLLKTPIVRNGYNFTVGVMEKIWKEWLNN